MLGLLCGSPLSAQELSPSLAKALDLESAGKTRESVAAFREALSGASLVPAVLGLERAYHQLGVLDSILPVLDGAQRQRPDEAALHLVRLRTLAALDRWREGGAWFEGWARLAPRDPGPYREWARILLDEGRAQAADTVIRSAITALGSGRELAPELAQLRAQLGLWEPSAQGWRDALARQPYLWQAAQFALQPTPADARDPVLAALLAQPVDAAARRAASALAMAWGRPADAWRAVSVLPPGDSTAALWRELAQELEERGAWREARDAWTAVSRATSDDASALRAASAALEVGDAETALTLADGVSRRATGDVARDALLLRLRALALTGRAAEAEKLLRDRAGSLDLPARRSATAILARGWVRAGDLPRARRALAEAGDDEEVEAAQGWVALYSGDLATARRLLLRAQERSAEAMLALPLLTRTRADSSRAVGDAFLVLARGDSAAAEGAFERAAAALPEAGSLLVTYAARIAAAQGTPAARDRALRLWTRVAEEFTASPEAAEAELEWARQLRARGRTADAIARLEHLILTHTGSALVPQARRELAELRAPTP